MKEELNTDEIIKQKLDNWFRRHTILTILGIVIIIAFLIWYNHVPYVKFYFSLPVTVPLRNSLTDFPA